MTDTPRAEALHLLRRAHHHEIRGALNALRLQLTLLQRGREKTSPDDPRFAQWIDGAAAEAGAVERALEELSAVEHIEETIASDDPATIAKRVAQLLEPLAKSRRVLLAVERSDNQTTAEAGSAPLESPGSLARQLLDLGATALSGTEPGESLEFRVGTKEIEISPGSIHLSYDQPSEQPPS